MARGGFRWISGSPERLAMGYIAGAVKNRDKVARATRIEMEVDATEAKERTPVDLGTLKGTVHVTGPTEQGDTIVTAIVAGGPAAPYAIYVHEDLEAFHKVGQAKFIESVIRESAPFMHDRIARRAKKL
jgi:hypothetical protein